MIPPSNCQLGPVFIKTIIYPNLILGRNLPDGTLNLHCPCLQGFHGKLTGPCGFETRQSFQCWVDNGNPEECIEKFKLLDECHKKNGLSNDFDDDNDDNDQDIETTSHTNVNNEQKYSS